LLQRGAGKVFAVDVGYGQIDDRLRQDERVVVMERTNARNLNRLPELVDLVVIDVSFISLGLIFPAVARISKPGGLCIPLIKPQFEAGRRDVGKGGVVRDPQVHRSVLERVVDEAEEHHLGLLGMIASPLLGPAGNVEFLAHFVSNHETGNESNYSTMIDQALREAATVARGEGGA
jgi:23S rRNA (cytidine1920-2'-O)/16S rRNA (cytidine1409-2'-O)-methyltransferase